MMDVSEKLIELAENNQKIFDSGKTAEHDAFWDSLLDNEDFTASFGTAWNRKTFKPTKKIYPKNGYMMFYGFSQNSNDEPWDFATEIDLDTSRCTKFTQMFSLSNIAKMGVIDARKSSDNLRYAFYQANVVSIDELILNDNATASNMDQNIFYACSTLVDIHKITGTISNSNWDLHWATTLAKQTLINIVNALSTTISGKSITFSKTAVNNAFGINVDDETTFPEGSEWYTLRNSRSNWTFNYA